MWTGRLSSDRRSVPSVRFARTDACRAGRYRRAEQTLSTARQSRAGHPRLCFFFPPFLPSPSHAQQQQQYGRARRAVEKLNQARSPLDPQLELGHTLTRSQLASAHSALAQSQSFPLSPTPPPSPPSSTLPLPCLLVLPSQQTSRSDQSHLHSNNTHHGRL